MKKPIFPILLVSFIGTLGMSIVIPFLVFLVTKFGGNALVYGVLAAVYPAFQLIGAPQLGKWSDIYGRKKILILSETGTLAGWIIFLVSFFLPATVLLDINLSSFGPFIVTLPLLILFIARAVDGISGGNISVANAYVADITDEKDRNKNFGKLSMSTNLGFIFGPVLAGLLGATVYGEMLPVIAAIIISLAAIIVTYILLPDPKPNTFNPDLETPAVGKVLGYEAKDCFKPECDDDSNITLKRILKLQSVPYFLLLNFLIFLGFNFFYSAFPIHVVQGLGWSITKMGLFFSILGMVMIIAQGPLLTYLSKKYSEKLLILFGSFILGTNFILLLSENMIVLYLAAVMFAIGNGIMWPSFLSLLSKVAGKKFQGAVQGYAASAGSLASIVGLVAGGFLYESIGSKTFLISAAVIYVVLLLSFKMPSQESFEVKGQA